MKKTLPLILISSIVLLLTWSAGYVPAEAQFTYDSWKVDAKAYSDPESQARTKRDTVWLGDFQEEEKEAIFLIHR